MAKKSNPIDDTLDNSKKVKEDISLTNSDAKEEIDTMEEGDLIDKFIKRTKLQNRILKKITITLNQSMEIEESKEDEDDKSNA
jgi:hypothetical protein